MMKFNPKNSVFAIAALLLIIFLYTDQYIIIWLTLSLLLLNLLSPRLTIVIDFFWSKIIWVLGLIMPKILLTIIFFLVLIPVAFLSRIFGKKDVLKLKNSYKSLFVDSNNRIDKSYFEKPW